MKNTKFLFIFIFAAIAILATSCSKEPRVSMSVDPNSISVTPGSYVDFTVTLTPATAKGGELGSFVVKDNNSQTIFSADYTGETSPKTVSIPYTVPQSTPTGTSLVITFEAVDGVSGKVTTDKAYLKVVSGLASVAITVDPTVVTASPEDTVDFVVELTPEVANDGQLGNFVVKDQYDNTVYSANYAGETNTKVVTVEYTVPVNAIPDSSITLSFYATDNGSGITNYTQAVINVVAGIPQMVTSTGKTVNYLSTSSTTDFGWALGVNDVGISEVNAGDADLCFFFNDTYRQQILSPNAGQILEQAQYSTWSYDTTGKHITLFKQMTTADFDSATAATINAITITDSQVHTGGGYGLELVQPGEVYAFITDDGRKGLFKVAASNPPYTKEPAVASSITLDFKFQATASAGK